MPLPGIIVTDDMTILSSPVTIVNKPNDYSYSVNATIGHREFYLREMLPGETITIEYSVTLVSADTSWEVMIQNFSKVTVPGDERYPDEDAFGDEDDEIVFTGRTTLPFAVKTADVVYADVGDWITYTVIITNNTDAPMVNMTLHDELSPGSATFEVLEGEEYYEGNKFFQFDNLAPGESVTLVYRYQVSLQDTRGSDVVENYLVRRPGGQYSNGVTVAIP